MQLAEENVEEKVEELSEVVLGRCEAGTYTPVQGDCTAFYQCVEGERMMKHCADGLHWNKNKNVCSLLLAFKKTFTSCQVCDWEEVAGCRLQPRQGGQKCQEV